MAILGNLLSALGVASRGSYGHGRRPSIGGSYGRGYRRSSPGIFGGSLGRMAVGGAAAYLTRSLMNRRRIS
jgi:hypothetical protein